LRLTVLAGGSSSEREVSLVSGRAVARALADEGYATELVTVGQDDLSYAAELQQPAAARRLDSSGSESAAEQAALARDESSGVVQYLRQTQLVFTTMHGTRGEDGVWQGVLELTGVPYVSADVRGSALAMDKLVSKRLFQQLGIPTPRYWVERRRQTCRGEVPAEIRHLVAKPVAQGSSVGIEMIDNDGDGWTAVEKLVKEFGTMLIEERIAGRELTAAIIGPGGEAVSLPLVEIKPLKRGFYDYTAKYIKGETEYLCPAPVSEETAELVHRHARTIYDEFGLAPYARIDCILDSLGTPWFLEANTLPGFTPLSLVPQAAAAAGIGFGELLEMLMLVALERWEAANRSEPS